MKKITKGC